MDPGRAELFEEIGKWASYVFLGLALTNGSLNSLLTGLDYQALMDAFDALQFNAFNGAMNVRVPPDVNRFLAAIKDAASVEPSQTLRESGEAMAEMVFGAYPNTTALTDELAQKGYDTVTPIEEIESVSFQFALACSAFILMILLHNWKFFRRSALAGLW